MVGIDSYGESAPAGDLFKHFKLTAANLVEDVRGAADRGVLVDAPRIDVDKLRAYKDGVVKKLVGGVGQLEKGNGVEVVKTRAQPIGVEVVVGEPVPPQQVSPEGLRQRVAALLEA